MREDVSIRRRIVELAEIMTQPEEQERPLLEALCTAAEEEIAGRLRDGLRPEDCGAIYPCAAAMLAAAGLLPCRESGRTGAGGGCQVGAALRRQAASLMRPYWRDDGFVFTGVRG